ncbi:MAG: hypothetical protein NTU53_03420 [Planctomycetota bacterium]|nr:hypothetical protein [Planctomycetota bacterium]
MIWQRPSPSEVWNAIDLYLQQAYPAGPSCAIRARLDSLRAISDPNFYDSRILECDPAPQPTRFSLRLGNRFYPHMKLVIERSPDGHTHLFRADTHDQHACPPPSSGEYAPFCQLMVQNQSIAHAIESAWEQHHLLTFKSYLRQDLQQRRHHP